MNPEPIIAMEEFLSNSPFILAIFRPNMVMVQNKNKILNELLKADIELIIIAAFSGLAKAENNLPNIIKNGAPGG